MKRFLSLLLAVIMVFTLAACGGSGKGENGKVYWLNFKPELDEALQTLATSYTKQTGVEVKVVTAASGKYEETLTAEMDKSEAPTLFNVGNAAGVKTWGDYCLDLKDTDAYNALTTTSFNQVDANGKVCSIGLCYEAYGIIVNQALLTKAGYKLDDIKDFDSLKKVAEDIHARAKDLGFDAFTSAGLDDSSSWRFSGHLANMPLYYEGKDAGWTECPATITGKYLDNFKAIWDLYTANSATDKTKLATAGLDAEAEFGKGEAVFYQNGTWEYANLTAADKYAMNADDLAMIPIYCGVAGEDKAGLCSGTENALAVNANASEADKTATLDFLKWMVTSEEGLKCLVDNLGGVPYKNAPESENPFFADGNALLAAGNYNVDWTFNYTPNVDDWRAAVVNAMVQYCSGGSWDAVKTAFVDGWATQYKAANS